MITPELKNAGAERQIAFRHVLDLAAALGNVAVTSLFYQGLTAGSEFLVYDVDKLYFALVFEFGQSSGVPVGGAANCELFDEANALSACIIDNVDSYWDVTAATVKVTRTGSLPHYDFYFSRIDPSAWTLFHFIGYRLDITH